MVETFHFEKMRRMRIGRYGASAVLTMAVISEDRPRISPGVAI
jgi:hypothetical protein